MTDMIRGVLEDSRKGILFNDFSGGLCTDTGGLSLAANQTPDSLNVFAWEGSLRFRGGYDTWSSLPSAADGAFTYYDINDNAHLVEWSGGNVYDVSSGTPVTVASGVYVPGQTIAHAQLNGILYWATATVPLRQWDGTTEKAVPNGGGVGTVPPPSCEFLVAFQGSLVAVNFTTTAGSQPGAFIWSNVNDPTTWLGANTQTVGSNDGGVCTFAILMGVAQVGVTPTKQFMVGKSNNQIFLYLGALGSLTENAVSSPVGIRDGASAVYIPTQQGLGAVMFLGDDGLFYLCNGIECPVASNNIKLLTNNLVNAALLQNPDQRFNAVYNQRFQYYMCDFGNNTQLIYKWDTGAWWYFQGWPSGVYTTFPTNNGLPTIFVGANYGSTTGVYELALDQTNDNGNPISAYWSSPYVHGGKPERLKLFQECTVFAYNVGVQYALTAEGLPQSNGVTPVTKTALLNDPAVGATPAVPTEVALWDQAVWDQSTWAGGSTGSLVQPYAIGGMKTPLIVPSGVSKWGPAGFPLPLRTGGAQFKIAYNAGIPDFRITSFKVAFLFQNENVGILPYSGQGQVTNVSPNPGDRFTNTGLPLPLDLPSSSQSIGCYSISGGILTRACVANEYVAFALGNIDSGTAAHVWAWDNTNQYVDLGAIDPTSSGETGIAVDLANNVMYSQIASNPDPPGDMVISSIKAASSYSSSLTGSFAPPASVSFAYPGGADTQYQYQSLVLSANRSTLYAVSFVSPGSFQILAITVSSGVVAAASSVIASQDTAQGLFVSPDGTKLYVIGWGSTSTDYIQIVTLDATTLSTISTVQQNTGGLQTIQGAAMSQDGSAIVISSVASNGQTTVYPYSTGSATFGSGFNVGPTSGFNGAITFLQKDNSHVLVYADGTLYVYSTGGSAGSTYSLSGIANEDGATQIVTEPNSGLIYGTSYSTGGDMILWVYDLNTSSVLTDQAVVPSADAMPNITFAT